MIQVKSEEIINKPTYWPVLPIKYFLRVKRSHTP